MNRWDEGSWDTDPQRHGRFTIIADRGNTAFTCGTLGCHTLNSYSVPDTIDVLRQLALF